MPPTLQSSAPLFLTFLIIPLLLSHNNINPSNNIRTPEKEREFPSINVSLPLTKDAAAIYLIIALCQQRVAVLLLLRSVPVGVASPRIHALQVPIWGQLRIDETLLLIVAEVNPILHVLVRWLRLLEVRVGDRQPRWSSWRDRQQSIGSSSRQPFILGQRGTDGSLLEGGLRLVPVPQVQTAVLNVSAGVGRADVVLLEGGYRLVAHVTAVCGGDRGLWSVQPEGIGAPKVTSILA